MSILELWVVSTSNCFEAMGTDFLTEWFHTYVSDFFAIGDILFHVLGGDCGSWVQMVDFAIFVLKHSICHFFEHSLSTDGGVVSDEINFFALALKPFDVLKSLSNLDIFSVPKDSITVKEKVVIF